MDKITIIMNREIKFRGIAEFGDLSGKWVYGSLVYDYDNETFISVSGYGHTGSAFSGCYKVLPETVGQFTGLKDKNGMEIYEGDIVKNESAGFFGVIKFKDSAFIIDIDKIKGTLFACLQTDSFEVMGNMHDNPELLNGGNYGQEDNH